MQNVSFSGLAPFFAFNLHLTLYQTLTDVSVFNFFATESILSTVSSLLVESESNICVNSQGHNLPPRQRKIWWSISWIMTNIAKSGLQLSVQNNNCYCEKKLKRHCIVISTYLEPGHGFLARCTPLGLIRPKNVELFWHPWGGVGE